MKHLRRWRPPLRMTARIQVASLTLAALLTHALWPGIAWAGCGVTDFSACADDAQYTIWYGLATFLWAVDAMLLQLAYLVDVLRVWVVETAFTSAYQVLITLVNPLIVPFATIALIIAVLLFFLTPLFGRIRALNVRHVLAWALVAPLLLTVSGPLIVQVEQARTTLGAAIFTDVSAIAPGAIFGVAATDMAAPTPLYGGNPCGTGALARPGAGTNGASLHMDDLAAAMLWANAQDIHCPKYSGPGQDIPDAFYVDPPDGPGFATANKVGDMNDTAARATAIANIQRGVTRLALGIVPSVLAVLEMLINLVFGLALIALWIGLPLGLAFIFFEESSGSIAMLLRQGLGVLKVSWASAFLMAILFAALKSSAEMGNAAAYTGLAGGAILLMAWLLLTAFDTLSGSVRTLSSAMLAGSGLNITQPFELAAGGASLAATSLVGGAALAATAAAAYQQTGSRRYAAGAAAGRFGKVAQLGEVAAAMGYLQDEDVVAGLHAGARSTRSYRTMRLQMLTDAQRKGDDGMTIRERAQERSLAGQVDDATAAGLWRGVNEGAAAAGAAARGAVVYVRSGQGFRDARAGGARMLEGIGDSWHRAHQGVTAFGAEIDARANAAGPSALGEIGMLTRGVASAIAVTHDRLAPDGRTGAYGLDAGGQLRRLERADAALPSGALSVPIAAANLPRLLRQGYAVQQNADQTVTIWPLDPQAAGAAPAQLARLYQDGALSKVEIQRAAAETLASGRPSEGPPPPAYLEVPPPEAGSYRVRVMMGGQAQSHQQLGSAAAVAELAAAQGLPVRMVASPPAQADASRPSESTVAPVPSSAPVPQRRVERLATQRSVGPVSNTPLAAPAAAAGDNPAPEAAAPQPTRSAPLADATAVTPPQPPAPAVLPAPAAHWLEQVRRQAAQAASPAQAPQSEPPAPAPDAGPMDPPATESETRAS